MSDDEKQVDLRTEEAQHNYDAMVIYDSIRAVRTNLAQAKVEWNLAQAGMLEGVHPNQIKPRIETELKRLDLLVSLANGLEDSDTATLPVPSALVIAASVNA